MRRRLIGAALVACSPNATPTLTEIPIDPGVVAEDCKTDVAPAAPVPRNPACLPPAVTSWLEPTVEWSVTGRAALGPTVVGDLDGDGRPELLSLRRNFSGLECLDGATGDVKWTSWAGTNPFGAAAIGDVDGDGVPEIVVSPAPMRSACSTRRAPRSGPPRSTTSVSRSTTPPSPTSMATGWLRS